ncbi:DeoR/GlpR family DNA-binding transcription regulator [Acidisoma cladoniae]|uniref:DeoR/GlpR family DNA-binding transcription regulator n=1 Tax=Acidisoma cladoniae TaxID=3040935 RepID=UPI00254FBEAB|nr:DeoR/GlpR family DNA-binding transcription regulator [Acidisoma sp. PAMC 29798]
MRLDERQQHILDLLGAVGRIEADLVAAQLRVSRETIRRDLMQLEKDGRVRRVHGGAVRVEPLGEKPFRTRKRVQIAAKRRIGATAATLLRAEQSCFIDAGTTTAAFAGALAGLDGLLVVTNSIEVAVNLRAVSANADVILLGGRMAIEVPATHGELTISEIGRFRTDFAVLSPVGIDALGGVTYHEFGEAEIARMMMKNAAATMLLADHTKLGRISRATVCGCGELDILVTDATADKTEAFRAAGVKRIVRAH